MRIGFAPSERAGAFASRSKLAVRRAGEKPAERGQRGSRQARRFRPRAKDHEPKPASRVRRGSPPGLQPPGTRGAHVAIETLLSLTCAGAAVMAARCPD